MKRVALHRAAILDAISKGTFDYAVTFPDSPRRFQFSQKKSDGYLLTEYLETWLDSIKKHYKASTYDDYRKIVTHTLIPNLHGVFLPDVSVSHVKELCAKMPNVTNKRLANVQSVLRTALDHAVTDELITINPIKNWKFTRRELVVSDEDDEIDPFTSEEQKLIIENCEDPQHANLFKFAFWSGLRTSELCALLWTDVNFAEGYVSITKAKTQASDNPELPKTSRSRRFVKLLVPAIEALEAQKLITYGLHEYVFLNPRTGEPWVGDQPIRQGAWQRALKNADVRYRKPYQTRHTYASMMLTSGENPAWIAGQMGHADTGMIFRNYGRWIRGANPEAGNKAVLMFGMRPE